MACHLQRQEQCADIFANASSMHAAPTPTHTRAREVDRWAAWAADVESRRAVGACCRGAGAALVHAHPFLDGDQESQSHVSTNGGHSSLARARGFIFASGEKRRATKGSWRTLTSLSVAIVTVVARARRVLAARVVAAHNPAARRPGHRCTPAMHIATVSMKHSPLSAFAY
jgi:hypothetical protein